MPFLPRPIDSTLHGVTDYMVGTTLTTVFPKLVDVEGTRSARQIRTAGAVHLTYSTMTDYPLGAAKVIPFKAHLALDAIGALILGATPFVTGQYKEGRKHWLPQVALCAFELMSLVMTDPTGEGDYHGNVEAIHEANQENPQRKIYEGGPAVKAPNGSGRVPADEPAAEQAAPTAEVAASHA